MESADPIRRALDTRIPFISKVSSQEELGVEDARLRQGAQLGSHPGYASLVGFATITELAALPTMFYLRIEHPEALPGVFLIADGVHLLILMRLHMDYTYFMDGFAKAVLGSLFLLGVLWEGSYPIQMLAGGVISLVAALFVWRDSHRTLELYLRPDSVQDAQ